MGSRVVKILVAIEAALILSTLLFVGGAALGLALPRLNPAAGTALGDWLTSPLPSAWTATPVSPAAADSPETLTGLFRPFWQAWDIMHDEFVDQPVDDTLMMQGAIRGMIDALGDE
ncbi:MAG: ctpA, partial [Anaerolineales bacterium]|nr:ctpA [Anaerolineales bacterium]